jgi:hypothetical protein
MMRGSSIVRAIGATSPDGPANQSPRSRPLAAPYRAALKERTREQAPLDRAETQNNLGMTLAVVGERESGTAPLEDAISAYRAALEEYTRERAPLDWAETQNKPELRSKCWASGRAARGGSKSRSRPSMRALTVSETAWPEKWVEEVRSHRDETRAEITRRRAADK